MFVRQSNWESEPGNEHGQSDSRRGYSTSELSLIVFRSMGCVKQVQNFRKDDQFCPELHFGGFVDWFSDFSLPYMKDCYKLSIVRDAASMLADINAFSPNKQVLCSLLWWKNCVLDKWKVTDKQMDICKIKYMHKF